MVMHKMKRGVALIIVVGVLAIVVILAVTFATSMLLQQHEAAAFLNSTKAQYIAEAGVNRALADFRNEVTTRPYNDLLTNYIGTYAATDVAFGDGTYTLIIQTEETKVNINTFDENDTTQINILKNAPCNLSPQQVANIIDYRDYDSVPSVVTMQVGNEINCKNAPYNSMEEVKAAFVNAGATAAQATDWYNQIKDHITISKPIIRGGLLGKYYQSITGSSPNVQINTSTFRGEIVELGHFEEHYLEGTDGDSWDQDSGWLESHDAEFTGGYLIATPGDFGIETFAVIWNGYIEILSSEIGSPITFWVQTDDGTRIFINGQNILPASAWQDQGATNYSGTYTFKAPGWHRIRIEYYDNAAGNTVRIRWKGASFDAASVIPAERFGYEAPTEAISPSTIPIVYNHAGNYKITSTAQIIKGVDVVAQKRFTTTMKIFGTWTQTMKDEFYAAWFNDYAVGVPSGYTTVDGNLPPSGGDDYRDGEIRNVTWLDSCPLNATDNLETSGYFSNLDDTTKFKRDSLKLGFWADFDNDPTSTVCNLKALVRSEKWGTDAWINIVKDDGAHNFFWISWGDIRDEWPLAAPDGDNELVIDTWWHEGRRFEVNPFYYFPSASDHKTVDGKPDVFMRVWTAVYPEPGVEAKAYWKGDGIEFTQGFDAFGNPNGPNVGSIPVVGGVEQIGAPYSGTGLYGWAYDWIDMDPGTNPDIPDGLYQLGERICKVWPAGVSRDYSDNNVRWGVNRKAIYDTSIYDINIQTGSYNYWQPDVPFTTPMIYACGERLDSVSGSGMQGARGFGLLEKDNDTYWDLSMKGWTYPEDNDILELTLDSVTGSSPPYLNRIAWLGLDYDPAPVLAIIGSNGNYIGWIRGKTPLGGALNRKAPQSGIPIAATTSITTTAANFQFLSRNCYDANDAWNVGGDWPKWMVPTVQRGVKELYRTGGNADQYPLDGSDNTSTTTYFDNIRIIPASGFLVSTPHVVGPWTGVVGATDVSWGTVSFMENEPPNTDVNIYLRMTSTGFPTTDTFATSYTNGASIGGTGRVIQYKVVLSSTAFSPSAAWGSTGGVTPRLDDITITYIPTVEIYAWKEAP